MVDGSLIDALTINAKMFGSRWKDRIRKAGQLKQYAKLDDDTLIEQGFRIFPMLARTLDRGLDRSLLGDFFVHEGKNRMNEGFPVSEVIYAVNLSQQTVIDYIMTDFVSDNPVRMYQAMGMLDKASEFFLLGCFYITKGFLEATYTMMSKKDAVSDELLKKYFRDDFFFKKD
jgi:hypothetical protein